MRKNSAAASRLIAIAKSLSISGAMKVMAEAKSFMSSRDRLQPHVCFSAFRMFLLRTLRTLNFRGVFWAGVLEDWASGEDPFWRGDCVRLMQSMIGRLAFIMALAS